MLDEWLTPEGVKFIGGLVALCLYLWLLTKFEKKRTPEQIKAEKEERETEFQNLWNAHILENVDKRAGEILAVGKENFVLRTTYHDAIGDLDGKFQRIMLDQSAQSGELRSQGADIKNLKDQLSALAALVSQTNVELRGIGSNVANIAGIWTEHVRQHGGLALSQKGQ